MTQSYSILVIANSFLEKKSYINIFTTTSDFNLLHGHAGCSLLFGQTQGSAPTTGCKTFVPFLPFSPL